MMIIVETLSQGSHGNQKVLGWVYVMIVRFVTIEMSGTVHQPRGVKAEKITEEGADVERVEETLTPEMPRHQSGQDETHKGN